MSESFPVYRVSSRTYQRTQEGTINLPRQFNSPRIVAEVGLDGKPVITARLLETLAAGIVSGNNPLYKISQAGIASVSSSELSVQVSGLSRQEVQTSRFLDRLARNEVVAGLSGGRTDEGKSIFEFALWTLGSYRGQPLPPGLYLPEDRAPIRPDPQTYCPFVEAFMLSSVVDGGYLIEHIVVDQAQIPIPMLLLREPAKRQT